MVIVNYVVSEFQIEHSVDLRENPQAIARINRSAENAQYWLGECYYSKGKYDQALIEFQRVRKFFPKSDKIFYADLKSAYSYYEKGQVELARQKLLSLSKYRSGQEYRHLIELAKLKFRIQKDSKK